MAATIYHLEIDIQGHRAHSYYSALKALWIDNKETVPSLSTLQKWNFDKPFIEDDSPNRIITICTGKSYNTSEARKANWIDELPPDVGAEHFDIKED